MKLSNRVLEMEESVTLAANARAKALAAEGRDILSLTLGQPDFATPKNIQEAAVASIEDGRASFYTVASGLPELKDAISDYMKEFYGYAVSRNEVVVGTGAKFILYAFFTSVINPGDEVIIPTPCWVSYVDQVKMVEGTPVTFQTTEENHFKATVEQCHDRMADWVCSGGSRDYRSYGQGDQPNNFQLNNRFPICRHRSPHRRPIFY